MGVLGLEKYIMALRPTPCPRVSVAALAEKHKKETGCDRAVAVVDGGYLVYQEAAGGGEELYGGQLKQLSERLVAFASLLQGAGVTPVFYFKGSPSKGRLGVWGNQKQQKQDRVRAAYASIAGWGAAPSRNQEVLVSIGEQDVEMARYCRRHECFALLARDTDFVAMDTAHYFLSVAHLRPDLTTVHFDRDAIARQMGLHGREQLPLLMALLPNGCVPASYLIPLHLQAAGQPLASLNPNMKFPLEAVVTRLCQLVRNRLCAVSAADAVVMVLDKSMSEYPASVMSEFARALGFAGSMEFREALRKQLAASLEAHDYRGSQGATLPPPGTEDTVLELARARHAAMQFVMPNVLVLLEGRVWEESCSLEDPALPARCCSTEALRPFRRRLYGVLLHERRAERTHRPVREFIVPNSGEGALRPVDVVPAELDEAAVHHPGLPALWCGMVMEEARWRLLSWCLCPSPRRGTDLLNRLRALPRRHALLAAALFLLSHCGVIGASIQASVGPSAKESISVRTASSDGEAAEAPPGHGAGIEYEPHSVEQVVRLFARTCIRVERLTAFEIEQLTPPRPRRLAVHLAALFLRACTHLLVLNDVIGAVVPVDEVQPASFFDGKVFHSLLAEDTARESGNADEDAIVLAVCSDYPCDSCSPVAPDDAGGDVTALAAAFAQQRL
ncbi:constitutive coactivator of peroxisome proliferator-activated receptor gamma-like isoform X2 [Thrips palmi]|uniref:Constitutive coactivator of peroxisome proliferator-activated receptor gamma-like isoform X2 n=1 Tax=Thrips palmi TaxID=161013 RepID=A0A6P8Y209_THRPL|nr:constitutive coactivator of peroxisome proliferator-activated receptor gamma-like isoform X2 [Thrips palmi]